MQADRETAIKATGLIILSSCAFGSLSTLTVLINRSGLPLLPAMLWRYLIAAGILLVILQHQQQLIIAQEIESIGRERKCEDISATSGKLPVEGTV